MALLPSPVSFKIMLMPHNNEDNNNNKDLFKSFRILDPIYSFTCLFVLFTLNVKVLL